MSHITPDSDSVWVCMYVCLCPTSRLVRCMSQMMLSEIHIHVMNHAVSTFWFVRWSKCVIKRRGEPLSSFSFVTYLDAFRSPFSKAGLFISSSLRECIDSLDLFVNVDGDTTLPSKDGSALLIFSFGWVLVNLKHQESDLSGNLPFECYGAEFRFFTGSQPAFP
jgi:hypothetical protein